MSAFKLRYLNMDMATKEDQDLPAYDHTKLSNINACPTWGILRYSLHRVMPNSTRQMALEAGSTAHEAFAAIRWYQYRFFQCKTATSIDNAEFHGERLFNRIRFSQMFETISDKATHRTNIINFAIEAVESGDFYDDMTDKKRTISNISESIISYIDAYDMERYPIWVRDPSDPKTDIGIEIPFNIVAEIQYEVDDVLQPLFSCRFTGKLDGLQFNKEKLVAVDDKTASKLDDAWLTQWVLSHQLTGYCLAATTFTGIPCNDARVIGMKIPIGRVPAEGIRKEDVPRNKLLFEKWANWFVTTIQLEQRYIDSVTEAPMYTNNCYQYFRSCAFVPFCACETVEEKEQVIKEMEYDEWSPLA
jgi:hypothetical protein